MFTQWPLYRSMHDGEVRQPVCSHHKVLAGRGGRIRCIIRQPAASMVPTSWAMPKSVTLTTLPVSQEYNRT